MTPDRWVRFPVRTILTVLGIAIAIWALLHLLLVAKEVITWILIALFFALALNPAVGWLQRHGIRRRGFAVALACLSVVLFFVLLGWIVIPPLVSQVNDFAHKVPDYVHDLTKGRGRLGFLETKYHIVERVRHAVQEGGAAKKIFGLSGTAISITKSVVTVVAAVITIAALTFFMLLEGPLWIDRLYSLFPARSEARWRGVGRDIASAVGGYVTGNLFISVLAGASSGLVMWIMGVPFALALGLLVGILDLVPLAGATIAGIIVGTVAFIHSVPAGIVVVVFFIVYQQIENHVLQPVVHGRTVQLSPLAVLVAVLVGASIAGILGALGAIPIAGAIQVLVIDWRRHHSRAEIPPATSVAASTAADP